MAHIQHSTVIPVGTKDLYEFISDYKKRTRLMPPDILLELVSLPAALQKGAQYDFILNRYGVRYPFTLVVDKVDPEKSFSEKTQFGIFETWTNTFLLEEHSENATLLTNIIHYQLPLGVLGTLFDDLWLKSDMTRILEFSHNKLKSFFE